MSKLHHHRRSQRDMLDGGMMMGGNALEVSSAFGGESRAGDEDGRSATQTDTSASLMGSMQGSYLNMIQTSAIFAFIQAFRYSPPWYLYNVVITTYLLLTIPLSTPPALHWGPTFQKVFGVIYAFRNLGFQYATVGTFRVIYGLFIGIYVILLCMLVLCVVAFWQGKSIFQKLRMYFLYPATFIAVVGVPLTYSYGMVLHCKTGGYSTFGLRDCLGGNMIAWNILAIICIVAQFLHTLFVVHTTAVTAVGKRGCFYSLESQFFILYEVGTISLYVAIETATIQVSFLRPLLLVIQSFVGAGYLIYRLPYYRRLANSLHGGFIFARFFVGLVSLIGPAVNKDNRNIPGIVSGSVALGVFFMAFALGIIVIEVYARIIIWRARKFDAMLRGQDVKRVSPFVIEMYGRLAITMGEEERSQAEKLLKMCVHYNIENASIYILLATYNTYFHKESPQRTQRLLRSAFGTNPDVFTKISILYHFADTEAEMSDQSSSVQVFSMISKGKKTQKNYSANVRVFWKKILEKTVDFRSVEQAIMSTHFNFEELEKIYSSMYDQFPKNPNVLRSYAEYLEKVHHDTATAEAMKEVAENMEQNIQRAQIARKSVFPTNFSQSLHYPPQSQDSIIHSSNRVAPSDENMPGPDRSQEFKPSFHNHNHSNNNNQNSYDNDEHEQHQELIELGDKDEFEDSISVNSHGEGERVAKQAILVPKRQPFAASIVASITAFLVIVLIAVLLMNEFGMNNQNSGEIMDACQMQAISYDIIANWRQIHKDYAFKGDMTTNETEYLVSAIKARVAVLYDTVMKSAGQAANVPSRKLLTQKLVPVTVPIVPSNTSVTSYAWNSSISDLVKQYYRSVHETHREDVLVTVNAFNFMFVWYNRRIVADYLQTYCTYFYQEFQNNRAEQRSMFIAIIIVLAVAYPLYYLGCFIPAAVSFFRERRKIISTFEIIPKEVVGQVYHSLADGSENHHDENKVKTSTVNLPVVKITGIAAAITLLSFVCVAIVIADSALKLYGKSGSSELISYSGQLGRAVNEALFITGETILPDPQLRVESDYAIDRVVVLLGYMKSNWNALAFGIGTKVGRGVYGFTKEIDRYIKTDGLCLEGVFSSMDHEKWYCKSAETLIETIIYKLGVLSHNYLILNETERINIYSSSMSIANAINDRTVKITELFSDYSRRSAGLGFDIYYVFIACLILIVALSVPMFIWIRQETKINHTIRKMLHYLPLDSIMAIPEIHNYVFNRTFQQRKIEKVDDSAKTKAILETSTDGVALCSTDGVIMDLNSATRAMWEISDTDVIGTSLIQWFQESEELSQLLKEVVKTGKTISNKEFSGITKKGNTFPLKLSLGVGRWGSKTVITIFARDCTVEVKQNALIQQEKKNSESLLLNILPAPIAVRLKKGETCIADAIDDVTCFFSDMVGFTKMSSAMTATELVDLLNEIVRKFDELSAFHEIEKIKTIGDAYFAVGGLHGSDKTHPERVIRFGLDAIASLEKYGGRIQIRCGCHTGPIVAGVIGATKFAYDVWGDTVNVASRMESTGIAMKVQCSRSTYERCYDMFEFEERTGVYLKGKGEKTTYIVIREKTDSVLKRGKINTTRKASVVMENLHFENGTPVSIQTPLKQADDKVFALTEEALKQHQSWIKNTRTTDVQDVTTNEDDNNIDT